MESNQAFNRRHQWTDSPAGVASCGRAIWGKEEEAVTSRLTSRGADRWDRMSATAREKKEGTRALCLAGWGWAAVGPPGSHACGKSLLGWPFLFFLSKAFSLFQNTKQNTSFKMKLQMSSNLFLKFCTNQIHLTRHKT